MKKIAAASLLITSLSVGLTACSDSGDVEEFCNRASSTIDDSETADDFVEGIREMEKVAPGEIKPDLNVLIEHLQDDPNSDEVNDSLENVDQYVGEHCTV